MGYVVATTTVTATKNDANAGDPVIKLGDTVITNGVVDLAVGENVVTVTIDGRGRQHERPTRSTVTRAAASTDATLGKTLHVERGDPVAQLHQRTVTYHGQRRRTTSQRRRSRRRRPTPRPLWPSRRSTPTRGPADTRWAWRLVKPPSRWTVTAEDDSTKTYTLTVTRDKPTVTISTAAGTVNEGGTVTFTVSRATGGRGGAGR